MLGDIIPISVARSRITITGALEGLSGELDGALARFPGDNDVPGFLPLLWFNLSAVMEVESSPKRSNNAATVLSSRSILYIVSLVFKKTNSYSTEHLSSHSLCLLEKQMSGQMNTAG